MVLTVTGKRDVQRQRRLADLVERLGSGIDAAGEIWANWYEGEGFGQDHPGMSPGQYITSLGLRLTLPEAFEAMPNASSRQIAAVAGVDHSTVVRSRGASAPPAAVRGADGKAYPAHVTRTAAAATVVVIDDTAWTELLAVADVLARLGERIPATIAAAVPHRRRQATARRLRSLGLVLGRIASELEYLKEDL